ncbi:MAG TPA: FxsA family protein [Pseudogracilibacillus sp.]|nr:FxsA family protein [Pseudogracilibacillus sp.]
MFWILLITFIIVPTIEIALFIWTGGQLGIWAVIVLILLTGILGTIIVRYEGVQTMRRAQASIQRGDIPKDEILEGICILIGSVLLITPGFFTDIVGFFVVFPLTRKPFTRLIKKIIAKKIAKGRIIYRRW